MAAGGKEGARMESKDKRKYHFVLKLELNSCHRSFLHSDQFQRFTPSANIWTREST